MFNKNHDWFIKELSLPKPPLNLIDLARSKSSLYAEYQGHRFPLNDWRGESYVAPAIVRKFFDQKFIDWANENVTTDFDMAGIMTCDGDLATPSTGAHTDKTRDLALIYTVLPGGDNTSIAFWKEKGFPTYRDRGIPIGDYNSLELIAEYPTPIDCWYLLNSRVLHSVEHMSSSRINLQLSFEGDWWPRGDSNS